MARIPEQELERLKREVSVARLAEARGVKLQRVGSDLHGLCPFHDDREPSLVISPERNLWHCLGACQAGGSVIDWVMRAEGMSFRHAVEWLRGQAPPAARLEPSPARPAPALRLDREADDDELLRQVLGFYQETLAQSPEALAYLDGRGLGSKEARLRFQLGFANRTLAYQLPESGREGAELRRRLQQLGILRDSGHEHFNGSVVVPIFDAAGRVVEIYGRKITRNLRKGTPLHLYLPGPHAGVEGARAAARRDQRQPLRADPQAAGSGRTPSSKPGRFERPERRGEHREAVAVLALRPAAPSSAAAPSGSSCPRVFAMTQQGAQDFAASSINAGKQMTITSTTVPRPAPALRLEREADDDELLRQVLGLGPSLLQSPDLLERILADFGRCGVVGEETNKLVGYLAAVSRQLDEPLAVIVQSSTAAGKSE
jgi:hypothetical protein